MKMFSNEILCQSTPHITITCTSHTDGIQVKHKRASKVAIGLSMEIHNFVRKQGTGKRNSELHVLQTLFQIRSLYHLKDLQIEVSGPIYFEMKFNFFWKPRNNKNLLNIVCVAVNMILHCTA